MASLIDSSCYDVPVASAVPAVMDRMAILQLSLLMLAIPAQYLLMKYTQVPDIQQRNSALQRSVHTHVHICVHLLVILHHYTVLSGAVVAFVDCGNTVVCIRGSIIEKSNI